MTERYCIKDPEGNLDLTTLDANEHQAWWNFDDQNNLTDEEIAYYISLGYRAVKVKIEEVSHE